MSNKVLTNEERRQRLKVELEKTKVRVDKADKKCNSIENKIEEIRTNLYELNYLKKKLESRAIDILNILAIMIALASVISISLSIPAFLMIGFEFGILKSSILGMILIGISKKIIIDEIFASLEPKIEKMAINKLMKKKKYMNLLYSIKKYELEEKRTSEDLRKAIDNFTMALDAKDSLERQIFNFYDNHYNYKYVNDRKISYSKSKPLSSKKAKKKIKKLEKN